MSLRSFRLLYNDRRESCASKPSGSLVMIRGPLRYLLPSAVLRSSGTHNGTHFGWRRRQVKNIQASSHSSSSSHTGVLGGVYGSSLDDLNNDVLRLSKD